MLNSVQKDVLLIHEDHLTESTELTFMMIAAALIKRTIRWMSFMLIELRSG